MKTRENKIARQKIKIKSEPPSRAAVKSAPPKNIKKSHSPPVTIKKEKKETKRLRKLRPKTKMIKQIVTKIELSRSKSKSKSRSKSKSKNKSESRSRSKSESKSKSKSKKSKILPLKQVIITAKRIKEEVQDSEESASESEKKPEKPKVTLQKKKYHNQFSYHADSEKIKEEIEQVIKKIEDKKKSKASMLSAKRERPESIKGGPTKMTAQNYNYILQFNNNFKPSLIFVDLNELSKKIPINNSEILLALIEIAKNSSYYCINYSNKSKLFWEDIIQYKALSTIFEGYKSETLRRYWGMLSKFDGQKLYDTIIENKEFLDSIQIKLRTVVNSIAQFLEGRISNIEDYIKSIQFDTKKQEIFEEEYHDPETGEVTKIKDVRTTIRTRKKYEPGIVKQFTEKNYENPNLDEIFEEPKEEETGYIKTMRQLSEEDKNKFEYLSKFTEEEKKKLLTINEDDKFVFKVIDSVLDELCKEFNQYKREYVFEMLVANSMNIGRTFLCLEDTHEKDKLAFTPNDDRIILELKDKKEYFDLVDKKGREIVEEREEFLKG